MRYTFRKKSKNAKLAGPGRPVAATMGTEDSCPASCPLSRTGGDGSCYAGNGPMSWTWRKLSDGRIAGIDYDQLRQSLRALPVGHYIRINQAGDVHSAEELRGIAASGEHLVGWSYTHRKDADTLRAVRDTARAGGISWNASADTLAEAAEHMRAGIPTVVVVRSDAPKVTRLPEGRAVVCWAQQAEGRTCSDCRGARGVPWCADGKRDFAVAFRAHGARARKLDGRLHLQMAEG